MDNVNMALEQAQFEKQVEMSLRDIALAHAINFEKDNASRTDEVISTAKKFLEFLKNG